MDSEYIIIKESFLVVLDSRNATRCINSSWNSSVYFEFEDALQQDDYTIQMSCSILNFSASNSIYNINETNNFLSITVSSFQQYNINIPYGNYNFNTLQSAIYSIGIGNIKMSLNQSTNIITFTNAIDPLLMINASSTILPVIGGISKTAYTWETVGNNQVITMPFQCNFNGVNNINIFMPNLNTRNINSFTKTNSSIIQSIQVFPYAPQIIFNKTNDYSFAVNQKIIDYIQIDIKDDLERFINFNNASWNLTLCFTLMKEIPRNLDSFHSILRNGYNTN
jgi:hypothetical protein